MKVSQEEAYITLDGLLKPGSTVYIKKLYSMRDPNGNTRSLVSYLLIATVNKYNGPELCCLDASVAALVGLRMSNSSQHGSGVWVCGNGEEEIKNIAARLHYDYGTVRIERW